MHYQIRFFMSSSTKKTKVINFYQLKGGVGKTTLTCLVANELIWQDILLKQENPQEPFCVKDPLRVMVLDIDMQSSISTLRTEEIAILRAGGDGNRDLLNEMIKQKPWHKYLFEKYQYLYATYGWRCFDEAIISSTSTSVEKAINLIQSNQYDYVFMDFPGSYDQEHTGELLLYTEYLLIPCDLNSQLDVEAAKKFLNDIADVEFYQLRNIAFVANKHRVDSIRNKRNQALIEESTNLHFLNTKVKYCEYFKTDFLSTVYPRSVNLNLLTGAVTINNNMQSIIDLTQEIKTLI